MVYFAKGVYNFYPCFKAAGGVKNAEDVAEYLEHAADISGDNWITPAHFRCGASGLLASLLNTLGHGTEPAQDASY